MRLHTRIATLALAALLAGTAGCASDPPRKGGDDAAKAKSRLDIGADHLKSGRNALALREFMAAEQLNPGDPRVHYALGEAYLAQGKMADSELHYRRAVEIDPQHHDAWLSLSALLIVEKRYAEATAICRELIDDPTYPTPWRALANAGFAEFQLGHLAEARDLLQRAREYNENYWPASLSLAQLEVQEGRRLDALHLLQSALEIQPGPNVEAELNYRIAEIYVSLGRREEAMGHLTTAVARAPRGVWGKRSEEYLQLLK
jgi:type IV pilus assembly protein PilF